MVYKPLEALSFLLFPGRCLLCQHPSQRQRDLCDACEADLPWQVHACGVCALPLVSGDTCGECLRRPPPFAKVRAPFIYDFPMDRLINRFKHQGNPACGRVLGQLLGDWLASQSAPQPDALVPVPLHWRRRWQRGFNQAEVLARDLGQQLALPLMTNTLARTRATPAQQGLNAWARQRNLRGAFQVRTDVRNKRLAVVDDVITTTATSRSVASSLLEAGAQSVEIWCLARTP